MDLRSNGALRESLEADKALFRWRRAFPALGLSMPFKPPLTKKEMAKAFAGSYARFSMIRSGGQGSVFKAFPTGSSTCVALKIYFPGQVQERTTREVEALRQLHGDTIVRLYAYGKQRIRGHDCLYVATTFIDGETLSQRLKRGAVDPRNVVRIGRDIAEAIDMLWQKRIVHRDIKPSNIVLAQTGRSVLIDLGIARYLDHATITSPGVSLGTYGYMSPEQFGASRKLTCKSDIFSLGIVLQEALAGRHPTQNNQVALQNGGPRTVSLRPGTPVELAELIDGMVDAKPFKRPDPARVAKEVMKAVP